MRILTLLFLLLLSPAVVVAQATPLSLRGMGYVSGLSVHPSAPHDIYARTDVAGVFRWDRNAAKWTALLDTLSNTYPEVMNVEALALDPADAQTLYVAFGSYSNRSDDGLNGILRSVDGGSTWTLTSFPAGVQMGGNSHWRHASERLMVDPVNSQVLYFASRQDGLWRSVDRGVTWAQIAGVPLGDNAGSTQDGQPVNGGIMFVAADASVTTSADGPLRSGRVYLGIMGAGVYRSSDGGNSFSLLPAQPSATLNPIQGRLASDGTLYVTLAADEGVSGGGAVWRWRHSTWTVITPPVPNFTWSTRNWSGIAVDPANPDRIALTDRSSSPRDTFLSTDAGATWRIHTSDPANAFTPGLHRAVTFTLPPWWDTTDHLFSWSGGVFFDPADTRHLWISTGFGVYRHSDINASAGVFDALNHMEGLEELVGTRVLSLPAVHGGGALLGAMDMAGFVVKDPAVVPEFHLGNLPISNSTGLGVSAQTNAMVVSLAEHGLGAGRVIRSLDGGVTWSIIASASYGESIAGDVAISATDPNRIVWIPFNAGWYPGDHPPRFTSDGGQTWQTCAAIPGYFNGLTIWNGATNVLEADTVNGLVFYAFHESTSEPWGGAIWRSTDGGATWSLRSRVLSVWWQSILRARPGVEGELWYSDTKANFSRSTDGGATFAALPGWTQINAFGFGPDKVYAVGVRNAQLGFYLSADHGATWERVEGFDNIPLTMVSSITGDLSVPGRVFFALNGRGFMTADLFRFRISTEDFPTIPGRLYTVEHAATLIGDDVWQALETHTLLPGTGANIDLPRLPEGFLRVRVSVP